MNVTFAQDPDPINPVKKKKTTIRVSVAFTDAVEFARTRLGLEPDQQQREMLLSKAKRGILLCTRQWGKSTVAAAKAVHRAFTVAKCTVIVASPGDRQSGEFLRKAEGMIESLNIRPRGDGYNKLSLLLPNGSRIVGLPASETRVRGFSAPSMLMIDEAARVGDELYHALRPMLSVGNGDLWLMSTPRGKTGFFYETWEHAGPEWLRVKVPATECPRISKAFLEEQRSAMGMEAFRQEHMCEFVGSGMSVFDRDLVEAALEDTVEELVV